MSSPNPKMRRFSFDVPLPARVYDPKIAQRRFPKDTKDPSSVVMAHALCLIAGRALVIGWTAAMGNALEAGEEDRVWKLFEAALSVPIRVRICPDPDTCHLASLLFSESIFASSHPTNGKERHVQAHLVWVGAASLNPTYYVINANANINIKTNINMLSLIHI